jgi:LruC domain-containing protein
MNTEYFGTEDDASVPKENKFFVRASDYPFAFFLMDGKIDDFKNTILKGSNERKKIDELFPGFILWSTTKGTQNSDWYLKPAN